MTAEEVLVKNKVFTTPNKDEAFNLIFHRDAYRKAQSNIYNAMIEFAQYHVEKALEAAGEKVFAQSTSSNMTSKNNSLTCVHLGKVYVNKDSILECYPKENIK